MGVDAVHARYVDFWIRAQTLCEHEWTKGDIFERFGTKYDDRHYGLTGQFWANMFVFRVNARTRHFMHLWESLCADYHLISDEQSRVAGSPSFIENRHDQSLLSMLVKASSAVAGKCRDPHEDDKRSFRLHPTYGVANMTVSFCLSSAKERRNG